MTGPGLSRPSARVAPVVTRSQWVAAAAAFALAVLMLTTFYGLVRGAVDKAEATRAAQRVAALREARCTNASPSAARDLCMLEVAVAPRLVHRAGAQSVGPSGLQARAD